jgi:cytochrome P450
VKQVSNPSNPLDHGIDAHQAAAFTLADADDSFIDNPYPMYAALRRHHPVHALGPHSWLLTRHADVLALYRDARTSSDKQREFAPKFGNSPLFEHHTTSLVFNDPPLHTRVRRLLMGALDQRAIARMQPGVEALVDGLLDRMEDVAAPDLIEDFAAGIPVDVIGNLLDVPAADRGPVRGWSLAILSALEPVPGAERLERGNRAVTVFVAYLKELVAHRRRHPGDAQVDVLTRLIQGEINGERLSENELLHNCIFLLNAGHETTTNLIGNGSHALLGQRDQWERLAGASELLPTAVEELLRFEARCS